MKRLLLLLSFLGIFAVLNAQTQLYQTDFQDSTEAIANWLIFSPNPGVGHDYHWHLAYYDGNNNWWLSASGWDGNQDVASEQWAITPAINVGDNINITLNFDNRARYGTTPALQVFYSTDFSGDTTQYSNATWNEITGITLDVNDGDYDFVNSGNLDFIVDANATLYIAFKFTSEDGNGCNWSLDNIVITGSNGTSGVVKKVLYSSVYPNPTVDQIYLSVDGNINKVEIYNLLGEKVLEQNSSSRLVNVSNLTSGYYTIIITTDNGTITDKFIKK